ncbi:CHAT domain-containing protein [Leptolyngbya cf. ectocarpi LEGE 11479]|uniref:CHAT domain-containing protein n=1 Tax=Leptolyngbya cf. ectocarpi LEGE 11479 TaxID=1828722 RepID=A0A928ZXH4_LEPEC|nr:CHAT domain-containing protein [Leptolyngbya ectocarpi]MBE9069256.1 CHAT domain-containing protein [Leptolyngbya cf. ectocarpi LEGE 11479]
MGHPGGKRLNHYGLPIAGGLGIFTLAMAPAWAQIVPIGTTSITTDGAQIQITGGVSSTDGENLFHQFETFNVETMETATFMAPASVENILGRVNGGQLSTIDGGLAVSNSANLWLLNPAGIFFGPNAHLNLQGDFTAATADAVGFNQGWFIEGIEDTDYQALVAAPHSLAFISSPAPLINLGNLHVAAGQNLRLLGGSVDNTGTLSAPAGSITVAALSNTNRVNLSQTGQLLTLEIEPWTEDVPSLTHLPTLLTGRSVDSADTLTIATDGTPQLTQAGVTTAPDIGQASISGTVNSAGENGGHILILGEQISLVDATLNADGIYQGGQIHIGGDYQGAGSWPNAIHTQVNQNTELRANALHQGNGGQIIVWADQSTDFGGNAQVQGGAQGGNGGFIEISGKSNLDFNGQFSLGAPQGESGTILFDPDTIRIVSGGTAADTATESTLFPVVSATDRDLGILTLHAATLESWSGDDNIIFQANLNINIDLGGNNDLTFQPGTGSITFVADANNNNTGTFSMTGAGDQINTSGRNISISGPLITLESINTQSATGAGNLSLTAPFLTTVEGSLNAGNITIKSNELNLNGGNASVSGSALVITPDNPATEINLGPTTNTLFELDLLGTDILALQDGFTTITIGRSDGTSDVTLYDSITDTGATPFRDPVTLLGANRLRGPDQLTHWTITDENQGNLNSLFSNGLRFENTHSIVVGNGSNDLIQGDMGNDTFIFSGIDTGTLKGIGFAGIQNIYGGAGDDRFIFENGAVMSGLIDGGSGADTLQGSSGTDAIAITANNTGTLSNVTFTDIENIEGSAGNDIFLFNDGASLTGTLSGGEGLDAVDYNNYATAITVDLQTRRGSTMGAFNTVETFVGSNHDDTFRLSENNFVRSINGGAGNDTFLGDTVDSIWNLTAVNTGNGPGITSFENIENLTAGDQLDQVNFLASDARFTGNLEGGEGPLILNGDSIGIGTAITGTDELILQPASAHQNIQLGGADLTPDLTQTLTISTAELSNIDDGFTAITIGHPEGSGTITLGADVTLPAPTTLQSPNSDGTINTQGFDLAASEIILSAAQDILTANLSAPNGISLSSSHGAINTQNVVTNGGRVAVDAGTTLTTQQIDTAGTAGTGGNVILKAPDTIQVQTIRAEGAGGSIAIATEDFFRATDSFISLDGHIASISTAALNGTGTITINHGGNSSTAFEVGDGTLLGSEAVITTGAFQIPSGSSFLNSHTLGNISILTQDLNIPVAAIPQVIAASTAVPAAAIPSAVTPAAAIPSASINSPVTVDFSSPRIESDPATIEELTFSLSSDDSNKALFNRLENSYSEQFKSHLNLYGRVSVSPTNLATAQQTLGNVEALMGIKPGVLYIYFLPPTAKDTALPDSSGLTPEDELGLLLLTPDGQTVRRKVKGVTRGEVMAVTEDFYAQITNPISGASQYLPPAQQLYSWLIAPIEDQLHQQNIQSLALAMDTGLRTLPAAALHNGEEFLIERYSLGVIPSFSLTDFNPENFLYTQLETTQLLAMGASQFPSQQVLPAVPEELNSITKTFHDSEVFLNENFTLDNLQTQVARNKFGIVHLASHGIFEPGEPSHSYIQLWDQPLKLDQVHTLGLQAADIALMVLSACNTALGDREAEYGFAGLAVNAGVQTSVASLWPISDEGTLGLMTYFYKHLQQQPVRAVALRQAQLAMLQGDLQFADGTLYGLDDAALAHFPDLEHHGRWNFEHPFYWSTYTLVGSPW